MAPSLRVLVVEEDGVWRSRCEEVLRLHAGPAATVVGAQSADEAQRLIQAAPPDILVTGALNARAGLMLLQLARTLHPGGARVLMVEDGDEGLARAGRSHGGKVLQKPTTARELEEALLDALRPHLRARR